MICCLYSFLDISQKTQEIDLRFIEELLSIFVLKYLSKAWGDRRKWALTSMEDLVFIFLLRYLLKA